MSTYASTMAKPLSNRFLGSLFLCCALLTGCAGSMQNTSNEKSSLESTIAAAETELLKGKREQAVALLSDAAHNHPTSTAPWLRIANIWYDAGNYPSSILAANEVLQRDASSQEAKSLLVVAGLRVAASAVTGLRPSGAIGTHVRTDAENLTNALRDMLGEKVLVPGSPADARAGASSRQKPRANNQRLSSNPAMQGTIPSARSTTADPFKTLK